MDKAKKEARDRKRHARAFRFFKILLTPIFKLKFNYTFDKIPKLDKPFLLLANHNLNVDAVLVDMASENHMYFVASEHLLRGGLGAKFVMRYFRPIIHTKGKTGVKTLGDMMKALKSGCNVALFPEGNRSFNGLTGEIPENTGRIAKKSGAYLITYRMEGGYFTHPRWSTSVRRGKLHGKLVKIYSPEELGDMTDESINEAISRNLYEDAYQTQKDWNVPYKGKNLSLGLESLLYMCPKCRGFGTLSSSPKNIKCTSCGMQAEYTPYGYIKTSDGETLFTSQLDKDQHDALRSKVESASCDEVLFEDDISVFRINEKHVPVDEIKEHIKAYKNRVETGGKILTVSDIYGLSITARNILGIHLDGGKRQLEVRCGIPFNGLKYMYLYKFNGGN